MFEKYRRTNPVAWRTDDYRTDKSATTYDPVVADRWLQKGWPVNPLYEFPPDAAEQLERLDDLNVSLVAGLAAREAEIEQLQGAAGYVVDCYADGDLTGMKDAVARLCDVLAGTKDTVGPSFKGERRYAL